ncbi:coiled-coil domain-containing protein, partial [Citrobacter freundii]
MSEVTDLVVIEKSSAMAVFTNNEQLDPIIEKIEKEARSLVPDVSTKKGRDAIASMAHKVARSKTYIDNAGKDLVAELKALPKQIDESRRIVRERLDALKDEVRRPLTEWEAEQERIKAEEAAKIKAEEDRKKFESDHEIALLMNDKHDREVAEKKAEAERQRIAHEEELKRQAAEQAKREAEEKAAAELAAAKKREEDAIAARAQAELLAKQAQERAEHEAKDAAAKAEAEKKAAIEAEQRKAHEEADRIKREAEAKEAARLAEEKRIADEKAKREADVKHRKAVGTEIVNALTANTSISR